MKECRTERDAEAAQLLLDQRVHPLNGHQPAFADNAFAVTHRLHLGENVGAEEDGAPILPRLAHNL